LGGLKGAGEVAVPLYVIPDDHIYDPPKYVWQRIRPSDTAVLRESEVGDALPPYTVLPLQKPALHQPYPPIFASLLRLSSSPRLSWSTLGVPKAAQVPWGERHHTHAVHAFSAAARARPMRAGRAEGGHEDHADRMALRRGRHRRAAVGLIVMLLVTVLVMVVVGLLLLLVVMVIPVVTNRGDSSIH